MLDTLSYLIEKNQTARNIHISNKDLSHVDLQYLRGDSLVFDNVNLSHALLNHIQWRHCQLQHVNLNKTLLKKATLRLCEWNNVQASYSHFTQAKFENSSAQACIFDDADFSHASLIDSDMSRASLQRTNLQHATVTELNLRGADLRGANLTHVDFAEVDLRGADLRGTTLESSQFEYADIRGAVFDEKIQSGVNTSEESPIFSAPMQELANSLSPLITTLLKEGTDKDLLSENTVIKLMQEIKELTPLNAETHNTHEGASQQYQEMINSILTHVGETGIELLLDSLRDDKETPSDAVAKILQGLSQDLRLSKQATTEDLLSQLIKRLDRTV
ncbi:hypothetical protein AB835_00610 [Candidatus Endobugula sertula]|uniref:Pentapeptide repeat-containing protein n=1 Tax=Candidatus Endobugula sertula TaxID=62101 RepID=A0A1D2QU21_9GAMM|nr:hypothetical protein AB835_00610 [Candidatus Endobugula sertula]